MIKEELEEKLKEINEIIKKEYSNSTSVGVLEGLSGISLFQFYYSRYLNNNDFNNDGIETLNLCIEKINNGNCYSTYCNGISGFGWVLDHLVQENFINIDNDSYLVHFDKHLKASMITNLKNGNYEFLYGAVGIACYFLNRFKNTKSINLKNKYKNTLLEFVSQLKDISEKESDNKIMWLTLINREKNEIGCNLGVSHGISAIIGLLTRLYNYPEFKLSTKLILEESINFLIGTSESDLKSFSLFPNSIPNKEKETCKSRLGWCYGDLGIGLILFRASIAINDEKLKKTSLTILRHSAKRTTLKKSWVDNPFICHGSYGISLIFDRIYKETGEQIFKESKEFWAELGFNMISKNQSGSYKDWEFKKINLESNISIISGLAGIGLIIINFISHSDSNWDEILFIS